MSGRDSSSGRGRGRGRGRGGRGRGRGRGSFYKNKYGGGGRGGSFSGNEAGSADGGDDAASKSSNGGATTDDLPKTGFSPSPPSAPDKPYTYPKGGDNGGDHSALVELLRRLDGKQYPGYHDIESATKGWVNETDGYSLYIARAQSDPFSKPTRCRVIVKSETAKFPPVSYQNKIRNVALSDYLNRAFYDCCKNMGANVADGDTGHGGGSAHWNAPKGGDIEVSIYYFICNVNIYFELEHQLNNHFYFVMILDFPAYSTCY